jgi:predicted component of type VI protein secretion system
MTNDDPVTKETVERLCAQADLPLRPERRTKLVPMLAGLIAAANELNRKMAAAAHRSILPILRFPER